MPEKHFPTSGSERHEGYNLHVYQLLVLPPERWWNRWRWRIQWQGWTLDGAAFTERKARQRADQAARYQISYRLRCNARAKRWVKEEVTVRV